ncbi:MULTISPECIES: hypothetical protein [unclassified Pseudofrankia]|uniref:hypothetical protein n=1 Tax=unclassified Pseudofrankia TaxID=2994372 RepID=UPI0008DA1AD3|nr:MULTISPECIES: hypothetical protein [unclassified Pseudofrankia]MDT3442003.1 hypothetical protein [Pseudofrankia sp. BMG5.37]MDT3442549.1 hypothetical protein [Pseudofrankia sp. BMG5.37]MDT3446094.1 hypothetical protein [Pseudofrankia sp. BMG5.37]OHV55379.1 hypothetical protein BCD48_08875 [Pseudofrankia sp. BMG5.36]
MGHPGSPTCVGSSSSYLWACPVGIDWFVMLADTVDTDTVGKVFRAVYAQPLTPHQLTRLWPAGPRIGGPGAPATPERPAIRMRS